MIEFPATGGVLTSWSFTTVKLLRYVDAYDYCIMASQIVYALFILFYFIEELLDVSLLQV